MTESLYLSTPVLYREVGFLPRLSQCVADYTPAAVLLRLADDSEKNLCDFIAQVCPVVQGTGSALILEDRPALAQGTGCDGVHLSSAFTGRTIKDVRRLLGDSIQLGIAAGISRDVAMCAGEDGADYILFGEDAPQSAAAIKETQQLISWWSMMMELPAVALVPAPRSMAGFVAAQPDFIMPGANFWEQQEEWNLSSLV
ncbi:thiamine phosphate synthase [Acetobacter thailandicus]|uniref:thiamine phosphate synthase n=1 Tax=Acetobacter thailandicus TaxID=1502842 RepID=UPI001BA7D311|nr:thiamine phosphate synthase [Acetobacter thailandicus]MBS0986767.1 thiamine phosphate synthase [Acetobacter thailandicus]